jgi:uncharacterized protein (DUF433 family)
MAKEVFPGITVDSQVVHGRSVIAGTRVAVEVVLGELACGSSFEDVRADYHLTDEQIRAALGYGTRLLGATIAYYAVSPCGGLRGRTRLRHWASDPYGL